MLPTWFKVYLFAMWFLYLGFHLGMHDKPKEGRYSFLVALFTVIVSFVIYWFAGVFR